ncbi:hypothetical protein ACYF6T_03565 [Streptomyces sp. 7R007]
MTENPSAAQRPTTPGPVTRDHVRQLLAPGGGSATLVVLEGRAEVIDAGELDSDRYAGAVDVVSGEELARRAGSDLPAGQDLDALTGVLNTMVAKLGA